MKVALLKLTVYGAVALIGACLAGYGVMVAAEKLVDPYPTGT